MERKRFPKIYTPKQQICRKFYLILDWFCSVQFELTVCIGWWVILCRVGCIGRLLICQMYIVTLIRIIHSLSNNQRLLFDNLRILGHKNDIRAILCSWVHAVKFGCLEKTLWWNTITLSSLHCLCRHTRLISRIQLPLFMCCFILPPNSYACIYMPMYMYIYI